MDAVERGIQLATTNFKDVPDKAIIYARYLCGKFGGCSEIFITAFTTYSQIEEGLTTEDESYKLYPEHKEWYEEAQQMYHIVKEDDKITVKRKN